MDQAWIKLASVWFFSALKILLEMTSPELLMVLMVNPFLSFSFRTSLDGV